MSKKLTKYDIAISFTEKDVAVAQKMATALRKKGFEVYFYKQENQVGQQLDRIIEHVFGNRSNYGLVILSREYRQKTWTMIEWRTLQKARKKYRIKKVFIVKIDEDVHLPGLKSTTIYEKWNDNASEIANRIKEQSTFPPNRTFKFILRILLLLLVSLGIFFSIELGIFEWN